MTQILESVADQEKQVAIATRKLADAGPIQPMVTDVLMPHMSRRELAERLALLRPEM